MRPVWYSAFWEAVLARLNTAKMGRMLQGGKIYLEGQDYSRPEGGAAVPWKRLVIVPGTNPWETENVTVFKVAIKFLCRVEHSNFQAEGYDHQLAMDAIMAECYDQLQGWAPEGLTRFKVMFPLYQYSHPQPLPLWDEQRGLWMNSIGFGLEATSL